MIENPDFEAILDADPTDQQTRLIYADFLEENGDTVYANGLRWIAENDRVPQVGNGQWNWLWVGDINQPTNSCWDIPRNIWEKNGNILLTNGYPTRQAAERDLANALAAAAKTAIEKPA